MSDQIFILHSVEEMEDLGKRIGERLVKGDLLLLQGGLGAGKTALARGIGQALGIHDVSSPTFVISKIHSAAIPLIHVDAYRLLGSELAVFDDLDLETRIPESITVVEWGDGFVERLRESYIKIEIDFREEPNERIVTLSGLEL
jgi:tRNA threonylcarbamoyladenosine biosynthesis protein TsaE